MQILSDDMIDFEQYERETDAKANVKPASQWVRDMIERLHSIDNEKRVLLPWERFHSLFAFRPGEVTLWAGQNGHGKTQVVSQVILSLLGQEEKAVIGSFEMKPMTTLQRMARMYSGFNPFAEEFRNEEAIQQLAELYKEFGEWTDGRLWLYDQQGTVDASRVIAMGRYSAKELGVGHVVIDSLMKCVRGEDDYNGQKEFVDELTALARDCQIHIHLVHHLKKPDNENAIPDKHHSKGSGAITDLVDNVMMVWRNKAKEDDLKAHGMNAKKRDEHDAAILCRKQRNGEDEPTFRLWFDRESQQFLDSASATPLYFRNWPHRQTSSYA